MVRYFKDNSTQFTRGLQIWQILIAKAFNRQTITYGELADLLEFGGAGVFSPLLNPIKYYCRQNNLPPLTVIVVQQATGIPGSGIESIDPSAEREQVFRYNWFAIYPPTLEELESAHQLHT